MGKFGNVSQFETKEENEYVKKIKENWYLVFIYLGLHVPLFVFKINATDNLGLILGVLGYELWLILLLLIIVTVKLQIKKMIKGGKNGI